MRRQLPKRVPAGRLLRQRGASAVEFALIFPVMFMLSYGAIVYSYAYVLRQSMTFAAQEGAEAAVAIDPDIDKNPGYDAQVVAAANATVNSITDWMPSSVKGAMVTTVTFCKDGGGAPCPSDGSDAVVVKLQLPMTGSSAMFATFTLPGIGAFPPFPPIMSAQAVARV